jgi:hypothetical protein
LATGCAPSGTAGEAESAVREELRAAVVYDTAEITCTGSPRLATEDADVSLCLVRRRMGGCDRFRVEFLSGARVRVTLDERDAGCIVPG